MFGVVNLCHMVAFHYPAHAQTLEQEAKIRYTLARNTVRYNTHLLTIRPPPVPSPLLGTWTVFRSFGLVGGASGSERGRLTFLRRLLGIECGVDPVE